MNRDRAGAYVLVLLCVAAIIAGIALVARFLLTGGTSGELLAGLGGIGCAAGLLRFTRARNRAA